MARKEMLKRIDQLSSRTASPTGAEFRLKDIDPGDTGGSAPRTSRAPRRRSPTGVQWLADLQDKLYAQDRWAVLLIFQAMDAAGKDGTIKHVMSGVNPQGCQVYSFKAPSAEELDHDYLWRCMKRLPERGRIGIFNRSYYEEVLVVRVHPEFLARQKLPRRARHARRSGRSASRTSALRALPRAQRHRRSASSSSTSRARSRRSASSSASTSRRRTGSSPSADVAERAHWDDYMAPTRT